MATKRNKPTPGHKFKGAKIGFQARCECGWSSGVWFTEGARRNAIGEWHMHIEMCQREQAS